MLATIPLRFLLCVLHRSLGLFSDVANLRLGGAQVFVDGALGFLRVVSGHAASHFLYLACSFLHPSVNLIFIDSHMSSLPALLWPAYGGGIGTTVGLQVRWRRRAAGQKRNCLWPSGLDPDLQNIVERCLAVEQVDTLEQDFKLIAAALERMAIRAGKVPGRIPAQLHHLKPRAYGYFGVAH